MCMYIHVTYNKAVFVQTCMYVFECVVKISWRCRHREFKEEHCSALYMYMYINFVHIWFKSKVDVLHKPPDYYKMEDIPGGVGPTGGWAGGKIFPPFVLRTRISCLSAAISWAWMRVSCLSSLLSWTAVSLPVPPVAIPCVWQPQLIHVHVRISIHYVHSAYRPDSIKSGPAALQLTNMNNLHHLTQLYLHVHVYTCIPRSHRVGTYKNLNNLRQEWDMGTCAIL